MTTIEIATLPGFMLRKGKFGPPDTLWLTHQHATIAPLAEVLEPGYFDQLISDASVHPLDHIKVVSTANDQVETIEVLVTEKIANIDAANGVGSVTVQIVGAPPLLSIDPGILDPPAGFVKGERRWNAVKQTHEVVVDGKVVAEIKDKNSAQDVADGVIPLPVREAA